MKLAQREWVLAWATAAVAVAGVTYALAAAHLGDWKDLRTAREALNRRQATAQRLLRQKDEVNQRLATVLSRLPRYPAGQDVSANLLQTLEKTAGEQALTLSRREPDKEKSVGDLYEVAINCTWEADLSGLVHFLYALQQPGAILDIRQLTVTPGPGKAGSLRGNFVLDCAYSREGGTPAEERPAPGKPPATKRAARTGQR